MTKEFDYANVMQVPRIAKVVVNIGIGEAKDNDKALDAAVGDVVTITGQKPAADQGPQVGRGVQAARRPDRRHQERRCAGAACGTSSTSC